MVLGVPVLLLAGWIVLGAAWADESFAAEDERAAEIAAFQQRVVLLDDDETTDDADAVSFVLASPSELAHLRRLFVAASRQWAAGRSPPRPIEETRTWRDQRRARVDRFALDDAEALADALRVERPLLPQPIRLESGLALAETPATASSASSAAATPSALPKLPPTFDDGDDDLDELPDDSTFAPRVVDRGSVLTRVAGIPECDTLYALPDVFLRRLRESSESDADALARSWWRAIEALGRGPMHHLTPDMQAEERARVDPLRLVVIVRALLTLARLPEATGRSLYIARWGYC
jgi:hypothetical protein